MSRRPTMVKRAEDYLEARRALGLELRISGQQLLKFARWADQGWPRAVLTETLALTWARTSTRPTSTGPARRLEIIRPFARWLVGHEPATEVPAAELLGPAHPRRVPFVFSDRKIAQLLAAAHHLEPRRGLRPRTMRTLFGLLACTGLRPGEPVRFTRDDVDLRLGRLHVRNTKFSKSRLVPLHPSATRALHAYTKARDRLAPHAACDAFFLLDGGRPLTLRKAHWAFKGIRARLGWEVPGRAVPRLYDLRHRFACERLTQWHAAGLDVNSHLPDLATYLGHVKFTDTYWYLTGVPSLMAACTERFESFAPQSTGGVS